MGNQKRTFILFVLFLFLNFLLNACQSSTPQASTQQAQTASHSPIFPDVEIPIPIPQPDNGKANIVGKIVGPDPVETIGLILYLGDLIQLDESQVGGFLDPSRAPRALFDPKTGEFFFQNVEPGEYSFILYQVELGGQVYNSSDGSVEIIEALPNEINDLGDIVYK